MQGALPLSSRHSHTLEAQPRGLQRALGSQGRAESMTSMNKFLPYFFLFLFFSVSCEIEHEGENVVDTTANSEGVVMGDGLFSVSDVIQVEFAPGNLKAGGHGFTAHQYDYGGLFGWGTGNRPIYCFVVKMLGYSMEWLRCGVCRV